MIDHESVIFEALSSSLRANFPGIYVIGREISDKPSSFPAVSITQSGNEVNDRYSTFEEIEEVAIETYKIEIASNLEDGREKEIKRIMAVVDDIMKSFEYIRTFNQPVPATDSTVARRIVRYKNENSLNG